MKVYTESVILNAPKNKVFAYLTTYENITKWSVNFIHKLEKAADGYTVITPVGKMTFEIVADENTGVVDILLDGKPLPTRVVSLGPTTLYLFTLLAPPDMVDAEFQSGIKGLKEELALLKKQVEA